MKHSQKFCAIGYDNKQQAQVCFRYFPEKWGLLALQTKHWKLGRLAELNDPFDCQPVLNNVPPGVDAGHFTTQYLKKFNSRLGILCYCSKINDPVMWTHYAENHCGMALAFSYKGSDNLDTLFEVKYDDERPALNYQTLEDLSAKDDTGDFHNVIQNGFTRKGKRWEYESEYRHFLWLDKVTSILADGVSMIGSHYFKGISLRDFSGVVLGARCSITEFDIKRIYAEHNYHSDRDRVRLDWPVDDIRVCRAKMNPAAVTMDVDWPTGL